MIIPITKNAKPVNVFEQVKKHPEMLTPEPPLGCCPNCGTELNSQLQPYSETAEMTRIKNGLLLLSETELVKLRALLPATEEYDVTRFVIDFLTRLRQDTKAPVSRRAA